MSETDAKACQSLYRQSASITITFEMMLSERCSCRTPVDSLIIQSLKRVVLSALHGKCNPDLLQFLPPHLKQRMLRMITASSYYYNINSYLFKQTLDAILFDKCIHISLTAIHVDNDILKSLKKAVNLESLSLSLAGKVDVLSTELESLFNKLPQLKFFILRFCDGMTDQVLQGLVENCPKLTYLDLGGCQNISDVGIMKLNNLQNLTGLVLAKTKLSDKGISAIVERGQASKIQEFLIDNCDNITDIGISMILDNCPNISIFTFSNCPKVRGDVNTGLHSLKVLSWTIQ